VRSDAGMRHCLESRGFRWLDQHCHWFLSSGYSWAIGVIVTKVLDATGGVSLSVLCCEFNDTLLNRQGELRMVSVKCVCRSCDLRRTCDTGMC